MASLATPADLATKLKQDVDTSTAQQALDQASGLVRAVARQNLDYVDQETVILTGGTRKLVLPERPLDASRPLTVIELGDFGGVNYPCLEGRDYSRLGQELQRGQPWYNTTRTGGWPYLRVLGVWTPRVQVTYSHGFTTVPPEIIGVVLDFAAGRYDNPTSLTSVHIDDYTESKAASLLGEAAVKTVRAALADLGVRRQSFSIRTG